MNFLNELLMSFLNTGGQATILQHQAAQTQHARQEQRGYA